MIVSMWSLVAHQLENARKLAKLDKGRPRQASLRRAVSTAYYALFQALCEMCASRLIGHDKPWEAYTPIFRALEHHKISQVLLQRAGASALEFQRLGVAFNDLQAAREWADYNPEPRPNFDPLKRSSTFTRSEALDLIQLADDAVQILDRLDDAARLKLIARLISKSRK